ncbi:MAG: hypothetical protein U0172_03960 [Nitrospiraceae bacterium]
MNRSSIWGAILLGCAVLTNVAVTQAEESICSLPSTIFCDDFERATLERWEDGYNPSLHSLRTDPASPLPGNQALRATYPPGADGGWLTRWFMPGYDHVYGRLYVKFENGWTCGANCTKIFALYGNRIDNQWSAFGKAGIRPNGKDFFYSALVTTNTFRKPDPGELIFYSYFPEMTQSGDGNYWGNHFYQADPREAMQSGRWYCLELELQANTPGQHDGYQRMWIDGTPKGEVQGMRWRDTTDLRINAFQLSFSGPVYTTQYLWIDQVVVSQTRVGCLVGDSGAPAPPTGLKTN